MDKDAVYYCKAQWTNNQSPSAQIPSADSGIVSKNDKCSKEGEWEHEGSLADEVQSRKGKCLIAFRCSLIFVPFVIMNIS